MNSSRAQRLLLASACCLSLLAPVACKKSQPGTQQQQQQSSNPGTLNPLNVVFITLDTVRADHLHCYGDAKAKTPNIDSLAARGTLFEKAVTQTPLTTPSHASMFTGENPNVHGVRNTGGFALQPSHITLAHILQQNGWNTGAFISASVLYKAFGLNQGFNVYDDTMSQRGQDEGQEVSTRPANLTIDHANQWLQTTDGRPFFLWLHLYDAHAPYHPPAEYQKQFPNDPYDAEIAFEDHELGRFLKTLHEKSPDDKTLIVLLSDHGESLGDHGEYNHGVFLYDSTVRIAGIIAGPGVPAGQRLQVQARTIDFEPTILDLLGGHSLASIQGTSLVPALHGQPVDTTYSYEETLYPKINMSWSELRGIHTAHWMYVHAPRPELYDLDQDPGELHNVIDQHPKEYRELEAQLKTLSHLGNDGKEIVVQNQMDPKVMDQLRSLGYVGGSDNHQVELTGSGVDPKDRTDVLKILFIVLNEQSGSIPVAQKIALIQQGLAKYPTDPSLYYALGDQYQKGAGRPDLALQSSLDALHHGIHSPMLYSRLGQLYLAKGDLNNSITYFKQALDLNPADVNAQTGLGNAYSNAGLMNQAERQFQQALVMQPYAPAYSGLGLLAVRRGDFTTARTNFEHAIQTDPTYPDAQLNLGVLCMQTGDTPCARTAFNKFLAIASPVQYRDMIPKVHNALNTVLAQR